MRTEEWFSSCLPPSVDPAVDQKGGAITTGTTGWNCRRPPTYLRFCIGGVEEDNILGGNLIHLLQLVRLQNWLVLNRPVSGEDPAQDGVSASGFTLPYILAVCL